MEQSLWAAVPAYLRKLSAALQKHCGRPLPMGCVPVTFASWMGGDRDGNPTVTAKASRAPSLSRQLWTSTTIAARIMSMLDPIVALLIGLRACSRRHRSSRCSCTQPARDGGLRVKNDASALPPAGDARRVAPGEVDGGGPLPARGRGAALRGALADGKPDACSGSAHSPSHDLRYFADILRAQQCCTTPTACCAELESISHRLPRDSCPAQWWAQDITILYL